MLTQILPTFFVSDQVWRKSTKVLGSEKPDVDKDVRWVGIFICWNFFPLSFTYLPSRPRRLSVTPEPRSGLFAYFKRPTKNYDLIAQSLVLYLQSKEKRPHLHNFKTIMSDDTFFNLHRSNVSSLPPIGGFTNQTQASLSPSIGGRQNQHSRTMDIVTLALDSGKRLQIENQLNI